ncbi:hypothetical protein F5Y15DRAFT_228125 [Xylariaceae sp. FL0016]|nr:hypothetical protein F5Y15DRAFT_228125 [Xylariaceae sp. FL0016]
MADAAGTAVGLAGCVLKLVVFSIDFVSDAKQVHRQGATDRNLDLDTVSKSIESATRSLEDHLDKFKVLESERSKLDKDDEELRALAIRAAMIGKELSSSLEKTAGPRNEKSKWKSFKAVARGMWDAEDIQKTEKRLQGIREEMQLRILIGIKKRMEDANDDSFNNILEILEKLASGRTESREDSKRMLNMLTTAEDTSQRRHEEIVAIGKQLRDGLNALAAAQPVNPLPSQNKYSITKITDAQFAIVNMLWYSSMNDREESIAEAYTNTLQWIYNDPSTTGATWDSFVDFLRGDGMAYWITGKPGSGKSTLMKFIQKEPRTQGHLKAWAGDHEVLTASFYFFYNGIEMQKTEMGLIHSILRSLLRQKMELIPHVFPDRFQALLEGRKDPPPSILEAKSALRELILGNPELRFFITIDGLDEFDPKVSLTRVTSLIDFTRQLSEFDNVKVLVASRPLPNFELGYANYPFLRIHELTRGDISLYAEAKLVEHPRMKSIINKRPTDAQALIDSIADLSRGVFLWVRVVIESLLEGLTNHDDLEDLQTRLEGLPSDLESLYRVILKRVDPQYRSQTAKILAIVMYGTRGLWELSALGLWFAERAGDHEVIHAEVRSLEDDEVQERVEEIESRLKSRCLGLVESVPAELPEEPVGYWNPSEIKTDVYDMTSKFRKARVQFLHRSVFEFLGDPDVWLNFVKQHCESSFDARKSLFLSSILIIKTVKGTPDTIQAYLSGLIAYVGERAEILVKSDIHVRPDLLHTLGHAMDKLLEQSNGYVVSPKYDYAAHWSCPLYNRGTYRAHIEVESEEWSPLIGGYPRYAKEDTVRLPNQTDGSLLVFAIRYGIISFVEEMISKHKDSALKKHGLPLLDYALMPEKHPSVYSPPRKDIVELLLDHQQDPNEVYKKFSAWEWFLIAVRAGSVLYDKHAVYWGEVEYDLPIWACDATIESMDLMVSAGANPNAVMLWWGEPDDQTWNNWQCTILRAMSRVRDRLVDHPFYSLPGDWQEEAKANDHRLKLVEKFMGMLRDRGAVDIMWYKTRPVYPPLPNPQHYGYIWKYDMENRKVFPGFILSWKSNPDPNTWFPSEYDWRNDADAWKLIRATPHAVVPDAIEASDDVEDGTVAKADAGLKETGELPTDDKETVLSTSETSASALQMPPEKTKSRGWRRVFRKMKDKTASK